MVYNRIADHMQYFQPYATSPAITETVHSLDSVPATQDGQETAAHRVKKEDMIHKVDVLCFIPWQPCVTLSVPITGLAPTPMFAAALRNGVDTTAQTVKEQVPFTTWL